LPNKVFTSIDIAVEVNELKKLIADSRVNNVYQLDPETVMLKLHKVDMPPLLLLLQSGRRFHLTAYAQEKPRTPPAFCMALRKYLRDAWLRTVEQYEFERIVTFTFQAKDNISRLILELFGEGNIILTSANGVILQALIYKRMRDRNVVRGETYTLPPSSGRNPFKTTKDELEGDLRGCGDVEVVKTVARCLGVGGVYAEEILLRAGIEKTKPCSELTEAEVGAVYDSLRSLLTCIVDSKFEPGIVLNEDGSFIDVVPFKLERFEACKVQSFNNFNDALDEFYLRVAASEKTVGASAKIKELQREADKLKRVVAEQEQVVREAETKAEHDSRIGDLVYRHSVEVQTLLDKFSSARLEGRNLKVLASEFSNAGSHGPASGVKVDSFDARNLAVNVCVGDVHFSISLRRSLFENAAEYYDRGKRVKQKAAGALVALEDSRRKLADVERRIGEAEAALEAKPAEALEEIVKRKVKNKEWFEKFRWFISSDGFLVVAGKDAVSNEVLVKKHVAKNDPVFHADVTGSPFVVVKTEGKALSELVIREAGEFAASFSRGWREGMSSIDVYWVNLDQLSKTGPSGEYVAHGAFAVVGKRNWMRGLPLKVAVGVILDDEVSFVGGPVDAVKAKTNVYVTLIPGDVLGKELLKQILRSLSVNLPKEHREKVVKASVELFREFVPYTKGRIM
jgi:predicted ribosome quality control (RQC) complex YloA/Tae2 family protein